MYESILAAQTIIIASGTDTESRKKMLMYIFPPLNRFASEPPCAASAFIFQI
jgi:hypothetical protein